MSLVPIEEFENVGCVKEMFYEHTRQLDSIFGSEFIDDDTDSPKAESDGEGPGVVPPVEPAIEVIELDEKVE